MSASPLEFQGVVNTLSKLADRAFIRAFFVPALLGALVVGLLNADFASAESFFSSSRKEELIGYVSLAVSALWMLAMMLLVTSPAAYRVLEGSTWLGGKSKWLVQRQLRRRKAQRLMARVVYSELQALQERLHRESVEIDGGGPSYELRRTVEAKRKQYYLLTQQTLSSYPKDSSLVRATKFGNVVRAFEMYPATVYGVDGTRMWARLLGVISADFQSSLGDAKSRVDFWVSLTVLSALVASVAFIEALGASFYGWGGRPTIRFAAAFGLVFASRGSYLAGVSALGAWGEALNSAFDLYLPALARKLGYELPGSLSERQRFWSQLSFQMSFYEPIHPEDWPVALDAETKAGKSKNLDGKGESPEQDDNGEDDDSGDDEAPGEESPQK